MLALLASTIVGCSTRPVPTAADGAAISPWADGQPVPDRPQTTLPVPPTIPECIVALKLDTCCASPTPVAKAALAQDPCLVPYPYHAAPPPACTPSCGEIACDWAEPPTRLAQGLPNGTCTWKSECQADSDCVMALAWNICGCDCVQGRTLLDPSRCLTEPQPGPPAGGCTPVCDAMGLPCSSACVATNWIRAFCDTSKADSHYRVCNLVGGK